MKNQSLKLYSVAQVRDIESSAINAFGDDGAELMQRAAGAAFALLQRHWPNQRQLTVFCGPGNNGGDGYVLATLARAAGYQVDCYSIGNQVAGDNLARRVQHAFQKAGGIVTPWQCQAIASDSVVVDALFGIGLCRTLQGDARSAVEAINAFAGPCLALDLPSGINADTGSICGVAVEADITMSFIAHKKGLFTGAALDHCGQLALDHCDVDVKYFNTVRSDAQLASDLYFDYLQPRRADTHKGAFGHVLIVGGDDGMPGAVALSAMAALHAGAGKVTVATRASHCATIVSLCPEAMTAALEEGHALDKLLEKVDVVAVGPGLGQSAWSQSLLERVLAWSGPKVIDADALNIIATKPRSLQQAVITPHVGEASRLLGVDIEKINQDRFQAAAKLAEQYDAITVLKGAGTIVAAQSRPSFVCEHGNPGLATAGVGDVLTGVIAALLAQFSSEPKQHIAALAVDVHARAGDVMAARFGQRGLRASQLMEGITLCVNPL